MKKTKKKIYAGSLILKILVILAAVFTLVMLGYLIVYILAKGIPHLTPSLFSIHYDSDNVSMLPSIINTLIMIGVALLIAVPVGVFSAVYLTEYAKKGNKLVKVIRTTAETLTGIPSIVYGFFGLVLMVPLIRNTFGGTGTSWLAASLLLGIMILPTIIGPTESALRSVSESYYEGSLALGATKERSIFRVIIPAAKSGVIAGIVLGIGRAVGETMAVIMVAGNQPRLVGNLFKGIRTLTGNIVMEMGYATGLHREALIATGVVLFVFILIINFSVALLKRRTDHE